MRRHGNQVVWHLKQIRREFLLHRRGKSKCKSYPPRLRALAMEGIAAGIAGIRIAKAAGISTQSLVNWGKDTGSTATPRELVIVEDDSSSAESSTPTYHPIVHIIYVWTVATVPFWIWAWSQVKKKRDKLSTRHDDNFQSY